VEAKGSWEVRKRREERENSKPLAEGKETTG
jgi:hypothetical protein